MILLKKIIIFVISTLFFLNPVYSKKNGTTDLKNPIFKIPGSNKSVKIDGKISKGEWDHALKVELDNEIMPGDNIKPPVRTEVFIFHSHTSIYVAFKAYDPKVNQIRAYYNDRDSIWEDDTVGVGFDTFNSGNRAYYFSANPLGIQGDEMFSLGGQYEDNAWDAIWDAKGKITEYGYVVEFEIPFNAIQFHPGSEELTWGMLLFRNYPRAKRYMISNSKMNRNQSCWICQLSKIRGFKGVTPGKNIELDPTLTGLRVDSRDDLPNGKLTKEYSGLDPGISGK